MIDCDPSCATCSSSTPTSCLTCPHSIYFLSGTCVNPCPSNMYPDSNDMTCKCNELYFFASKLSFKS